MKKLSTATFCRCSRPVRPQNSKRIYENVRKSLADEGHDTWLLYFQLFTWYISDSHPWNKSRVGKVKQMVGSDFLAQTKNRTNFPMKDFKMNI